MGKHHWRHEKKDTTMHWWRNFVDEDDRTFEEKLIDRGISTGENGWYPIGDEHYLRPVYSSAHQLLAYEMAHRSFKHHEAICTSFYPVEDSLKEANPTLPIWTIQREEPTLTLSPSLVCGCGDHGFIRYGMWEGVFDKGRYRAWQFFAAKNKR